MSNQFINHEKGVDITWKTATDLIGKYNEHDDKWTVEVKIDTDADDSRFETKTLSAFRINIKELLPLLTTGIDGEEVNDLLIMLGYNDGKTKIRGIDEPRVGFTTILAGVDKDDNIIRTGHNKIQDYMDTVPPKKLKQIDFKDLHQWKPLESKS